DRPPRDTDPGQAGGSMEIAADRSRRIQCDSRRGRGRHLSLPDSRAGIQAGGLFRRSRALPQPSAARSALMLKVLRPGLLTTIQDAGRFGWYHIGMPPSGAMDQFSFRAGNLLVGNDQEAAALETTFLGPDLEAASDVTVAVTGAPLELRLNGAP